MNIERIVAYASDVSTRQKQLFAYRDALAEMGREYANAFDLDSSQIDRITYADLCAFAVNGFARNGDDVKMLSTLHQEFNLTPATHIGEMRDLINRDDKMDLLKLQFAKVIKEEAEDGR